MTAQKGSFDMAHAYPHAEEEDGQGTQGLVLHLTNSPHYHTRPG